MRILLDESVPRPLKNELPGHEVRTVVEMKWSGKLNGELLQLMKQNNFDVLLTVDQNIKYQQNLKNLTVAVVVMVARTNRLADLSPLMPEVRQVLGSISPGDLVEVGA